MQCSAFLVLGWPKPADGREMVGYVKEILMVFKNSKSGLRPTGRTNLLLAAAVAAGAAVALGSTSARATAIYQNAFNPTSTSTPLKGYTVTGGANTAAWGVGTNSSMTVNTYSDAGYVTAGSTSAQNNSYAYLPITSTMLSTYAQLTYTVTVTPTSEYSGGNTSDWLAMGFGKATGYAATLEGGLWTLYREDGGTQYFTGGGTGGANNGGSGTAHAADTITITLDTGVGGTTKGKYTITDSLGLFTSTGTLSSSVYTNYIGGVFIGGTSGANGKFTSLTLSGSVLVPEPASIGLLGLGGLGLLLLGKRRKTA